MSAASAVLGNDFIAAFRSAVADDLMQLASLHHREIDLEQIDMMAAVHFPDNLGMCLSSDQGRQALAMMKSAMEELKARRSEGLVDQLAVDYADIYLNHGLRASPYESVWLDEYQLMRQEPMFEVRKWYERYGFEASDWRNKPDDFLGLQLEFIAGLLDPARFSQVEHAEQQLGLVAEFMDAHVLKWVPDFAGRVVQRCGTQFYAALAALTDSYLDELRDQISAIIGQERPEIKMPEQSPATADNDEQAFVPGTAPSW